MNRKNYSFYNKRKDTNKSLNQAEMKDLYNDIGNAITRLNESYDSSMENQEKRFLVAFREHICKVQGDISKFKVKIEKEAGTAVIDGINGNMKKMIEDFRKETILLSKEESKQAEEIKQLKEEERNLEMEWYFLDKQMQKTHTENKIIKRELYKRKSISPNSISKSIESSKAEIHTDMRKLIEDQLNSNVPTEILIKNVENFIKNNDEQLDQEIRELRKAKDAQYSKQNTKYSSLICGVAPSEVKDMQSMFIDCLNSYQRGNYASADGRPSTKQYYAKYNKKVSDMVKVLLSDQQILLSFIDLMFANPIEEK